MLVGETSPIPLKNGYFVSGLRIRSGRYLYFCKHEICCLTTLPGHKKERCEEMACRPDLHTVFSSLLSILLLLQLLSFLLTSILLQHYLDNFLCHEIILHFRFLFPILCISFLFPFQICRIFCV